MNKGFIALTLTLVVAGTVLALVGASTIETAIFFDQALRKEYRFMNFYNAGNCIDQAVLILAEDYFYEIVTPLEMSQFNCTILSVTKSGDIRNISTRGDYQKAFVYRSAIIRMKIHELEVVKIE